MLIHDKSVLIIMSIFQNFLIRYLIFVNTEILKNYFPSYLRSNVDLYGSFVFAVH